MDYLDPAAPTCPHVHPHLHTYTHTHTHTHTHAHTYIHLHKFEHIISVRAAGDNDVHELQRGTVVGQRLQATQIRRRQHRGHGSSSQGEQEGEEEKDRAEDVQAQRRVCSREVSEAQEGLEGIELNDADRDERHVSADVAGSA